jgi:hypothetical protein
MNDAERDAWLREALRHAPDVGAMPPQGVSEAILAEARANARQAQTAPPRTPAAGVAPRHPLAAFWDWLARPPVAASFASVMAATLVGLMWWDRPMDETLPRHPEVTSDAAAKLELRGVGPAQSTAPLAKSAPAAPATANIAAPAAEPRAADASGATAPAQQPRRQLPAEEGAATRDAKVASPMASEKRKVEDAVDAKESAAPAERKVVKPAPFPATKDERSAMPAAPAFAKKDGDGRLAKSAEVAAAAGAPAEPSIVAAPSPAATARPPESARLRAAPESTTAPADRRADQEQARTSTATSDALDAAKSTPAPAAAATVPALRSGALADAREKQASAFASPPAVTRNEVAAAQNQSRSAAATPLAPVLASIASEPARWSRSSANGSVVALDAGWRDWLAQLDAAAIGRWRRVGSDSGAATSGARDGAIALRLLLADRPAGTVWLDGTSVRVDDVAAGERWQAILPGAVAEQLRAAAERLAR